MRARAIAISMVLAFAAGIGSPFSSGVLVANQQAFIPPGELIFTAGFEDQGFNEPPELQAVAPASLAPGQLLSFALQASDPEDDPLIFGALSLPDRASLDANTGLFSFRPGESDVGVHEIVFFVSDGSLFDIQTVTITVDVAPPGSTRLWGRVLDTDDFVADGTETPVEGAVVSIMGSGVSGSTDGNGEFVLENIPAGKQVLDIDPAGVPAPDSSEYAGFRSVVEISPDIENVLPRPLYLSRIAAESVTPVDPDQTTVVVNTTLGAQLVVEPSSAREAGEYFDADLSISEVPGALAPEELPEELGPGLLVTIQPASVVFNISAPVSLPNIDELPPGTTLDLWALDAFTGEWGIVGTGQVSPDGALVETVTGGVRTGGYLAYLPPMPSGSVSTPGGQRSRAATIESGSAVSLDSGDLSEFHRIRVPRSLNRDQSLDLSYHSDQAFPGLRFVLEPVFPGGDPIPQRIYSRLRVGGTESASEITTHLGGVYPLDGRIRQVLQLNTSFPIPYCTPYDVLLTHQYKLSTVSTRVGGTTTGNANFSLFGNGWKLHRLKRLYKRPGCGFVLDNGDGSSPQFPPAYAGNGTFTGTRNFEASDGIKSLLIEDLNGDQVPDFAFVTDGGTSATSDEKKLHVFFGDGNGDFDPLRIDLSAHAPPRAVAAGYLNTDPYPDFIITTQNRVLSLLSSGPGVWGTPDELEPRAQDPVISNGAFWIILDDFDNDTKTDILYPNFQTGSDGPHHLELMRGAGTGGFGPAIEIPVGEDPFNAVVTDLNGDVYPDVVVANQGSDETMVLVGDGSGGFNAHSSQVFGTSPQNLLTGDFTGDGLNDVVLTHQHSNNMLLLEGDGQGGLSVFSELAANDRYSSPQAGDFNRDGNVDIAYLIDGGGADSRVAVLRGNGSGGFDTGLSAINAGGDALMLASADMDQDGDPDLLAGLANGTTHNGRGVSLLRGEGDGSFEDTDIYKLESGTGNHFVNADFNGDHRMDLLMQGRNVGATLEVFLARPGGGFAPPLLHYTNLSVPDEQSEPVMEPGDFNHDGNMDIAWISNNRLAVVHGTGDGGFRPSAEDFLLGIQCGDPAVNCRGKRITSLDFDNDGDLDLAVEKDDFGRSPYLVGIYRNDGNGEFSKGLEAQLSASPRDLSAADVNDDGFMDIVSLLSNKISVVLNNTSGGWEVPVESPSLPYYLADAAFLNLNGDGIPDIAVVTAEEVWLLDGDGDGGFVNERAIPVQGFTGASPMGPQRIVSGDYNHDERDDLAVLGRNNDAILVLLGDGNGGFLSEERYAVGHAPWNLIAADFNHDGVIDLATIIRSADIMNGLSILHGKTTGEIVGTVASPGEFSNLTISSPVPASLLSTVGGKAAGAPSHEFERTLEDGTRELYDADGLLTEIIDRNGNTTRYKYDEQDRLVAIIDPASQETRFDYSSDRVSSVTDPAGRITRFRYDPHGNLELITDPDGSARSFTYDDQHRMTLQHSRRGYRTEYAYNFAGMVTSVTRPDQSTHLFSPAALVGMIDPDSGLGTQGNPALVVDPADAQTEFTDGNGHLTYVSTDEFGVVTERTDALGRTTSVTTNHDGLPTRIVWPNGAITERGYDARGNLITLREAVGSPLERVTRYGYESHRNLLTHRTDSNGNLTRFEYDERGNLTRQIDALDGERLYTYDAQGLLETLTDENNHTTTYGYDAQGNLEQITNALTEVTRIVRDAAGNITSITEGFGTPDARTSTFTYDELDRLLTARDGAGVNTRYGYDLDGNLDEIENGEGELTRLTYDGRSRPVNITRPESGAIAFTYDGNGNLAIRTNALEQATSYTYDAVDRLVKITDALQEKTTLGYDPGGNLNSITDPLLNETTFTYDLLNRQIEATDPYLQMATRAYDPMDNLVSAVDREAQEITYDYDALNRLVTRTAPDNNSTFSYDPAGNLLTVADTDSDIRFTYDSLNRVLTDETIDVGEQPNVVLTSTWDAAGNRNRLDLSTGESIVYGQDGGGRLASISTPSDGDIVLTRDDAGRVIEAAFPGDQSTRYEYDASGRLMRAEHGAEDAPTGQWIDYTYDDAGRVVTRTETGLVHTFGYDALGRITSAGTPSAPEFYTYDQAGNRTTSHLSSIYHYGSDNRLIEDDHYTYDYDSNGALISRVRKSNLEETSYAWNTERQLVRVDLPDSTVVNYRYDGLARRIQSSVSGDTTNFLYDGGHAVLEHHQPAAPATAFTAINVFADYSNSPVFREVDGELIVPFIGPDDSVYGLYGVTGIQTGTRRYEAFGLPTGLHPGPDYPWGWRAGYWEPDLEIWWLNGRPFDPGSGRMLGQPTISGPGLETPEQLITLDPGFH